MFAENGFDLCSFELLKKVTLIRTLNKYVSKNSQSNQHILKMFRSAQFLSLFFSTTLPIQPSIQKVSIIINFLDKCNGSQCF